MAKVWNQNAAKIDLEMQSSKAISTNQNLNSKQYEQTKYFACFWWEINIIVRKSSCCCLRWCGGERSFDLCRKHFFCLTFHTSSIGGCEKSCFLTGMPSWPGLSGLGGPGKKNATQEHWARKQLTRKLNVKNHFFKFSWYFFLVCYFGNGCY